MLAFLLYLCLGLLLARLLLSEHRPAIRCWLGLVFGCVLLCWLPCLFAFFLDFTAPAEYAALALAAGGSLFLAAQAFVRRERLFSAPDRTEQGSRDRTGLLLSNGYMPLESLSSECFARWVASGKIMNGTPSRITPVA